MIVGLTLEEAKGHAPFRMVEKVARMLRVPYYE
jgi:hypothetical protein